jgi:hypothetical protein
LKLACQQKRHVDWFFTSMFVMEGKGLLVSWMVWAQCVFILIEISSRVNC